jgi:hypothetical protein
MGILPVCRIELRNDRRFKCEDIDKLVRSEVSNNTK